MWARASTPVRRPGELQIPAPEGGSIKRPYGMPERHALIRNLNPIMKSQQKRSPLGLRCGHCRFGVVLLAFVLHPVMTHGANLEKSLRFFIEALAIHAVESRFSQDTEYCLWPEIIFIVKTMHCLENVIRWQTRILNVSQLMSTLIDHLVVADHEAILHRIIVQFGSRVSMSHGNLNRFHIQFLGERDRVTN